MKVIIVGAGAAGLMAAYHLSQHGVEVTVLEARERIGGRIHTLPGEMFSYPVEAGAEFVHGHVKTTSDVANEAGVKLKEMQGTFWKVENNKWNKNEVFIENEELLIHKLKNLQSDVSIASFLITEFGDGEFDSMRDSILRYVEGYDAADTKLASAFAFRDEWNNEEDVQFRPEGGYGRILEFLRDTSINQGAIIELSAAVTQVNWKKEHVKVTYKGGQVLSADKLIFTIPLGVWQSNGSIIGYPQVIPSIPTKTDAFFKMGYGAVIKIVLKFSQPFWKSKEVNNRIGEDITDMSFLISDAVFPTWWTYYPDDVPLLSGWMAGPEAGKRKLHSDTQLLDEAISSLSAIFRMDSPLLYQLLEKYFVANWAADPFAQGGYSYSTIYTKNVREIASSAIEQTLYYAGEAFYQGSEMGTVEAALASGLQTAKEITGSEL